MKSCIFLFFLIVTCGNLFGQTVVLDVDTREQQAQKAFGPNLEKFTHVTFGAGLLASGDSPGARIIYGNSVNLYFGIRRKYKISSVYSCGYDVDIQYTDYKFKQAEGKTFPDTILYNVSQRIDISTVAAGFYNRFNFDPSRGNYMGIFMDLGVSGGFDYSVKKISKSEAKVHIKTIESGLNYVNRFNAYAIFRIGKSHASLFAKYRITNQLKDSFKLPKLPRLIVGVELGAF